MNKIDFKKYFNDNLNNLFGLLRINSIYDLQSVSLDCPYGKGVKDALLFMKDLAIKDGFNVKEYNNEVITINYFENENSRFDIASHLDVVSVDDSWSFDPFIPFLNNGKIFGRGTSDMKVAAFLTYLALKLLREKYPKIKNEIRIVLGSDEERTMNDMRHYVDSVSKPLFAFSPDGSFPMCIGEKGALMWTLSGDYDGVIEELSGGIQCNIVPPICKVTLRNNYYTDDIKEYINKNNIDASVYDELNKTILEVKGIAVHCSRNYEGRNAIIDALEIIGNVTGDLFSKNIYEILADNFGQGLGIEKTSDTNFLTVNLGVLNIHNNILSGQVDARYPDYLTSKNLTNSFKEKCFINVSLDYDDLPTGCKIDDPYVKILLDTYQDVTKDLIEPFVSGGVSYSKVFNHSVTFGPSKLNKENTAHQKDEYIEVDDAIEALEIYYKTFEKLAFM